MTKYYVDDIKGHRLYEGFDEDTAYRLCRQYNNACGGTYAVDEIDTDLEDFYEDGENLVFISNGYLTELYGDDEEIKKDIKMTIEYQTGKKIIDFDLSYNDPGDSGFNATFWAKNIRWEKRECSKINEFKLNGKIVEIKKDKTILLKNTRKTMITLSCNSKLNIEKYHIGEQVEVSGYITTYKPLYTIQLVATKIKKEDE